MPVQNIGKALIVSHFLETSHVILVAKFSVALVTSWSQFWAVYKSGTGTRGRGHRDACVGTWDLGTRDEGLQDIKYGTRGRVERGRGDIKYRDAGDAECE